MNKFTAAVLKSHLERKKDAGRRPLSFVCFDIVEYLFEKPGKQSVD